MIEPPGNGKGALPGATSTLKNYAARTVAHTSSQDKLFPENVATLTAAGVDFHWRQSASDVITACPLCAGKLVMDQSRPWAICVGDMACLASTLPFEELLIKIARYRP